MNIEKISLSSEAYPLMLRLIKEPPKELYVQGDLSCVERPCLAIVGARKASAYGKWVAYNLAKKAASCQITVVSGMASGIDAESHRGALDAGGATIAVLGCGVDICYPANNRELRERIRRGGLLLSEYPPGTPPMPFRFPMRNRIISGLSQIVIIAEAGLSSGSLITAECALDQGREVFAVPGNINAVSSIGTNKLIQDGANPIVVLDDILRAMGVESQKTREERDATLGKDEIELLAKISEEGEATLDFLCFQLRKSAAEVGSLVTILEMKGELTTSMGKIFIAKF